MEPQAKLNEKYMSFGTLYIFYVFKVLLIEEYKIKLVCEFLYFLLFYIASESTSADTVFPIVGGGESYDFFSKTPPSKPMPPMGHPPT